MSNKSTSLSQLAS